MHKTVYHSKKTSEIREMDIQVSFYTKYPFFLSDVNRTWIFSTDFRKVSSKYLQREPNYSMQTERQTDMTKLTVAFSTFANTPEVTVITGHYFFPPQIIEDYNFWKYAQRVDRKTDWLRCGRFEIISHYRGELAKKSAFFPSQPLFIYYWWHNKEWAFPPKTITDWSL
jgi:hypothetical protein